MPDNDVQVEIFELGADGGRQIGLRRRATDALRQRSEDLRSAISEASTIAQESMAQLRERNGYQVSSMEVTFGLALSTEAGVVVSSASAEASFEVKLHVQRS